MIAAPGAVIGRQDELERLERFVTSTEALPAVLLLEGEAGIGKTTLLQAGIAAATRARYRVLSATPSEAEAQLSFAAAADLLQPVAEDALGPLPALQRAALETALLLQEEGVPVARRVVATAFLAALRSLASERPMLIAVDDVQWLDPESALLLSFAARRLRSERIALLLARRSGGGDSATPDLVDALGVTVECVPVEPLSLGALHRLLHERLGEPVPGRMLRRIHEISGGNPLFALELASAPAAPDDEISLPPSLERLVAARMRSLPLATRQSLAELAAARSAAAREPDPEVLAPAIDAGVLRVRPHGLEFTHPLLRAAAYAQLTPARRRELHRRLAAGAGDAEERARHLALAAEGRDNDVAAVVEEGAERAARRGAPAAAAELFEHAARMTLDDATRVRRTLRGAALRADSGDMGTARALLEALLHELPPGPLRAEALAALADDVGVEVERTLALAREGLDQPGLTDDVRAPLLLALSDAVFLQNDLALSSDYARQALSVARRGSDAAALARAHSWNGQLATLLANAEPWPLFERARTIERTLRHVDPWRAAGHWHGVSLMWADRLTEGRALLMEQYERALVTGSESARGALCFHLTQLECRAGELQRADRYAREGYEIATLIENDQLAGILLNARALVAAHAGDAAARGLVDEALEVSGGAGDAFFPIHHRVVLALLDASLGEYEAVHRHVGDLDEVMAQMGVREPGVFPFHGEELEALVALGELDAADRLAASLEARGREFQRPRLLALAERARGMLEAARGDVAGATEAFARALEEHERLELPLEHARTLLAQGVALRRGRQKRAARTALEEAAAIFDRHGARLWAKRARDELERVSGRPPSPGGLTPTQQRVAALAAAGKTNKEIAAELYITVRTVESHLTQVYEKLGVRTRAELGRRLPA